VNVIFLLACSLLTTPLMSDQSIARSYAYAQMTDLSPDDKMLFILNAQDGHLESKPMMKNRYMLTLYNVSKEVTYFTDRPARKAGKVSIDVFLQTFRQEQPNAGLVSAIHGNETMSPKFSDIAVTLSNPRYEAKHNRLTIDVDPIEKGVRVSTGDLGATTLFIDDFGPFPGG